MNLRDMEKARFKEKLMNDLEKHGVNAVDLGKGGTFDLIIEGQECFQRREKFEHSSTPG